MADFGLARAFTLPKGANLHAMVVTRWWRAPELLGKEAYDETVDYWSTAIVLAQMVHPAIRGYFQGDSAWGQAVHLETLWNAERGIMGGAIARVQCGVS